MLIVPSYRLTVDTREDLELIKLIIEKLYPSNPLFNLQDIINLLLANPEWAAINSHVEQKKLQIEMRGNHASLCYGTGTFLVWRILR